MTSHSDSRTVRLGLVGVGRIGRLHAQTVARQLKQAELVALTDIDQNSAQQVAREFGVPKVATKFQELVADPSIEAVVICSATNTHVPFIIEAAQHGKHIFCEKPIAADLSEIDKALSVVEKAGVKLMIGFNRRFDADIQRLKKAIDSGEIGTPHMLRLVSRDPAPPPIEYIKVSGGLFFDMTIHDFDVSRFLFGDVVEVYAAAGVLVDPAIGAAGDVDTAMITLKFANGAIGSIENSRRAVYGYDQRFEVFGSKGSAASANHYANTVTVSTNQSIARDLPLYFFLERYTGSYQAELGAFVRCLVEDTPPPVTGLDGRAPVVIAQAALISYKENRPVRLSEIK